MPQILPTYLSHCLYCFEMNIRAASILGYVGAGGLGILISERVGWRDYSGLGMVLLALFVLVVAIDFFSDTANTLPEVIRSCIAVKNSGSHADTIITFARGLFSKIRRHISKPLNG